MQEAMMNDPIDRRRIESMEHRQNTWITRNPDGEPQLQDCSRGEGRRDVQPPTVQAAEMMDDTMPQTPDTPDIP